MGLIEDKKHIEEMEQELKDILKGGIYTLEEVDRITRKGSKLLCKIIDAQILYDLRTKT